MLQAEMQSKKPTNQPTEIVYLYSLRHYILGVIRNAVCTEKMSFIVKRSVYLR